jgi:hypothetical protein
MKPIMLTETQMASVAHLSTREAAKVLGVGKSTISKYRIGPWGEKGEGIKAESSFSQGADGTVTLSLASGSFLTLEDAMQGLRDQSLDLSAYSVSYSTSTRELANGEERHAYTIRAVPNKTLPAELTDAHVDELIEIVNKYEFTPVIKAAHGETFVITPSDLQIGKTSFNGGTPETTEQVLASFGNAVEFVKEFRPERIVIAELGDPLENFYSTSSQRETNDLDITGQIRVARRLLLEGVKQLAPYAPSVYYAAVPSNHGSVRVNFKAPAGDNHNDWGLSILDQIEDAVRENNKLDHVKFFKPDYLYESLMVESSGTKLGMVHGHQACKADRLGEWWKGQDHGRQPVADADILLAGHFHSLRIQHSGNARWIMVSPASDPGSDWFTNITGEFSDSGMLTFTTANGHWDNLRIM